MIHRWFAWVLVPAVAAAQDSVPPAPVHAHRPHRQHAVALADSALRDSIVRMRWSAIAAEPVPATALLPSHRIVAFYGNPMSKRMGVLGAYPVDTMLARLATAAAGS